MKLFFIRLKKSNIDFKDPEIGFNAMTVINVKGVNLMEGIQMLTIRASNVNTKFYSLFSYFFYCIRSKSDLLLG